MALPALVLSWRSLPGVFRLVARLTLSLARLFDPSFNPCGVNFMSNKVVFELVIVQKSLVIGTSLRAIDIKSVDLIARLIKLKVFGMCSKSAFHVYVVDLPHYLVGNEEIDDELEHFATTRWLGGKAIRTVPFFIKNGKSWVVNQQLYSLVGRSLSGVGQ